VVGFYFSRRLKLFSNPVGDRRALSIMLEQSTRWGLRTAPGLAESPSVTVPVTLGAWHPFVLLPTAWRTWSDEKIQAVLAHELSHVARRDALTRALAAIHRSVFWFSPLAWWLERHLAVLAEQASDDSALRTGADRIFYANVLLGFYQDLQSVAGRVRWEGLAMTRGKQAHERVERILDSSRRLSAGLRKPAWAALALLAVPLIYLPAGAQPVVAQKLQGKNGQALALVKSPDAKPLYAELQAPPAGPPAPASPPTPAAPKPAPAAAPAPKPPTPPSGMWGTWTYGELGEEAVISYGDSFGGYGTFKSSDFDHFKALRRASNADFIWFRRNGKGYIIRDPATVEAAKEIYARLRLLEQTQANLEVQQDALSAQQEELSRQMERARVEVPDLTAELQKLLAQLDQVHKQGATQDQLNELQNALGDLQKKLSELQGEAGGQLGAIGGEKGELGGRQAELGDQMRQLAERQARLAKETSQKIKALLDDALAKGVAKPE
jgi:bla regulator protein blaR1